MKAEPTRTEILRAAHVFGLGGDIEGDPAREDSIDKIVFSCDDSIAFITCTDHVFHRPLSFLFTVGKSYIALHNANTEPEPLESWERQKPDLSKVGMKPGMKKKRIRDVDYCRYYEMFDATFAATELNGIPERIFLFVTHPNFNMELVIQLLRTYRILNPLPEVRELSRFCTQS